MNRWLALALLAVIALLPLTALSSAPAGAASPPPAAAGPDLSTGHTLYAVGYAHLDTQWRWAYPQVIREYLYNTLHDNFALFEKYPDYVFNFSGAHRYMLMKEYFPDEYAQLKQYVAQGRWFPCGSSMEEGDVNVPAAESILRHVLYGNHYFREEFGTASEEYMLPDCFGFPASLPSILAHCGIKGFSTQKLSWGSAVGIPFNVGVWQGPDGKGVVAAFNPGSYVGEVKDDLSSSKEWLDRIEANGKASGVYADYHYFGTGDTGGAPGVLSLGWLEKSVQGDGPVKVVAGKADQLFKDITPAQAQGLPRYSGDLELTQHSAGSITSGAFMKQCNRTNELLADAAEHAAVAANWLGALPYQQDKLNHAWTLALACQFHDMLPSTILPQGFEYAWNDELLATNQFADVLQTSCAAVASGLDTQVDGVPLVVYNPLGDWREDVVEAEIQIPEDAHWTPYVFGPDDTGEFPQVLSRTADTARILFTAHAPPCSFSVYEVRSVPNNEFDEFRTLSVDTTALHNEHYDVALNPNGDVTSIYDKQVGRELLAAPARLAFGGDAPGYWPAWNMDWDDQQKPPFAYVDGPAQIRIAEDGQRRVTLEVVREAQGSKFVQRISLCAGEAGKRVEFHNTIDWRSKSCHLKAVFPLSASNPQATYNWEVGTIQRSNNDEKKYEVPSHEWFDLTDKSGQFGATVLCPMKYGSDKPDDNTLRLTLLRTPGPVLNKDGTVSYDYADQCSQDWGRHEIDYALVGHSGDWRGAGTDRLAYEFEQPLIAFQADKHTGPLGKQFSLLSVDNPRIRVLAVKKAEDSDEMIIRLVDMQGLPPTSSPVRISFPAAVASAREVDGQERPLGPVEIADGALSANFTPYALHTFAVTLAKPAAPLSPPQSVPVSLPYNASVVTDRGEAATGGFDGDGRCLPAEMLPTSLADAGVTFQLAAAHQGAPDAVACQGQTIALPPGQHNRLYLLAAGSPEGKNLPFTIDGQAEALSIQDWGGYIGQWDNRVWRGDVPELVFSFTNALDSLTPGYVRPDPVAWFSSHRHKPWGQNDYYGYCYLFRYSLGIPPGAQTLTLPDAPGVKVMAISAAQVDGADFRPAQPLYDNLAGHPAAEFGGWLPEAPAKPSTPRE